MEIFDLTINDLLNLLIKNNCDFDAIDELIDKFSEIIDEYYETEIEEDGGKVILCFNLTQSSSFCVTNYNNSYEARIKGLKFIFTVPSRTSDKKEVNIFLKFDALTNYKLFSDGFTFMKINGNKWVDEINDETEFYIDGDACIIDVLQHLGNNIVYSDDKRKAFVFEYIQGDFANMDKRLEKEILYEIVTNSEFREKYLNECLFCEDGVELIEYIENNLKIGWTDILNDINENSSKLCNFKAYKEMFEFFKENAV